MENILLVEDDAEFNRIMCTYLHRNGYHVQGYQNPVEAFDNFDTNNYDLIISDIMMPQINGFDFARDVREKNSKIPILFITALSDFTSKQRGFLEGIDDYMVKPIDMDEMVLRVGALLRRNRIERKNRLTIGSLVLVRDEMAVYQEGQAVPIAPREFMVLFKLLSHPKKVFTRSELMGDFTGLTTDNSLRTADVYITKLRKVFASVNSFKIITVHGFGYKAVIQ
ncbi:response regulator transcription factor [Lactiplantibacillus modestisalitolerans]|uniref:Heme response regulator HssR n=1 Tax=Lactiplantibacillus modestisalitolerans TaxID=1457219 RepID=A0ABV5WW95_9LACO|nr:response regulator transcription factor [Lactiplantibacillus modestisalitolerans]